MFLLHVVGVLSYLFQEINPGCLGFVSMINFGMLKKKTQMENKSHLEKGPHPKINTFSPFSCSSMMVPTMGEFWCP